MSKEDDIGNGKLGKEDDLEEGSGLHGVLTNQTLMLGGQEDPEECPGRGLEDGGDQEFVPDQTLSSSTTASSVEESTVPSLTTIQH